jgi:hypothetical protein
MNLGEIYRQVLDLWNNPPYTELSPETLLACANRRITKQSIDLGLTPNAGFFLAISSAFTIDGYSKDLSGVIQDISRPLRVESRSAGSTGDNDWTEQRHVSFENWNDVGERGDGDFIAFYGIPPALTISTQTDGSNTEYRVIYQRLADKATSTSSLLDLPNVYEPFLVYDIALEAGELIDNQSPEFQKKKESKMVYLFNRKVEAEEQVDKWRKSQKGSSVTTRRAFNDRAAALETGSLQFTFRR